MDNKSKIGLWKTIIKEHKNGIEACNGIINKNRAEIQELDNSMKINKELVEEYKYQITEAYKRVKELEGNK